MKEQISKGLKDRESLLFIENVSLFLGGGFTEKREMGGCNSFIGKIREENHYFLMNDIK